MTPIQITQRKATGQLPDDAPVSAILRRLYEARGITKIEEVDFSLQRLSSYVLLPGVDAAVAVLERARQQQSRILIIGDYDADGTTGTVVLVKALRLFGYQQVDYMVPDRFRFGYGLSLSLVEAALFEKQPDLLLTVDNGVASIEGVAAAKAAGLDVVITDHHLPSAELPAADAIVNPCLADSAFPCKSLAGVGVAFYLMVALRRYLDQNGVLDASSVRLDSLLDLVAVGTIADIVPMDKDNRILVEQGLRRIRQGKGSSGIRALLQVAKRDFTKVVSSDLGFAVGPRLNAAGRLEDTATGILCLLTDDENEAVALAAQLNQFNIRRKEIEQKMQHEALLILSELTTLDTESGICLFHPSWHEGVIGIVASRLKDRFNRPAIIFAKSGDEMIKGSARSIAGVHIRDLIERIAIAEDGLISQFGGHAMAAGISLPLAHFERFKLLFAQQVSHYLDEDILKHQLFSDGGLDLDEMCYEMAEQIQLAAPWGKDFPEPLFDGVFKIVEKKVISDKHLKLLLCSEQEPQLLFRAIRFNFYGPAGEEIGIHGEHDFIGEDDTIRIVYRLETDDYAGRHSVTLNIQYMEIIDNRK